MQAWGCGRTSARIRKVPECFRNVSGQLLLDSECAKSRPSKKKRFLDGLLFCFVLLFVFVVRRPSHNFAFMEMKLDSPSPLLSYLIAAVKAGGGKEKKTSCQFCVFEVNNGRRRRRRKEEGRR